MSDSEKQSVYDKLTPQRKQLVDAILQNLEKGDKNWLQGWTESGAPKSAITGKIYNGVNRMMLTVAAMKKKYSDNRWLTYNQMSDKGWSFKTDEEGRGLGRGAGVPIEYYELRDKQTKKPFDKHVLDGMTTDEKNEYMDENVYPLRKYYRVFNAEVIEGIPAQERREIDPTGYNERAEKLLQLWSDTESKIIYGGDGAFYSPLSDEIHLPERNRFVDLPEFYSTALHEVGHSTGHEKRLNRDLSGGRGSPEYAAEELRAEIASMFMEQDLEIAVKEKHIENNSAYIQFWHDKIKEEPNVLFKAIADAERIAKSVMTKENELKKEVEPYAIIQDEDEYGETVYKVQMCAEYGQTRHALDYPFRNKDALTAELKYMQGMPYWKDKEFKEVSLDELEEISRERARAQEEKEERLTQIEEEKSEVYLPPSEVAARATVAAVKPVDMTDRGIESLTRMDDREIVDRAGKTKNGDKFYALFNGEAVLATEEKNERSLMSRLAMFTGDNGEQLLRIFRASGQYREDKPNAYYEKMAKDEMKFVAGLRGKINLPPVSASGKCGRYANAKS